MRKLFNTRRNLALHWLFIFTLLFTFVGQATMYVPKTYADHSDYHRSVSFVWFYASDQQLDPTSSQLGAIAQNAAGWYIEKMFTNVPFNPTRSQGSFVYKIAAPIQGAHPVSWYQECRKPAGCVTNLEAIVDNVRREVLPGQQFVDESLEPNEAKFRTAVMAMIQFGEPGDGGKCRGSASQNIGGGVLNVHSLEKYGCQYTDTDRPEYRFMQYQVTNHELGHVFGLHHEEGTFMDGDSYCDWLLSCVMTAAQAEYLRDVSPFFHPPQVPGVETSSTSTYPVPPGFMQKLYEQ